MKTVTGRIKAIKQPRGGYVKPSEFDVIVFDDGLSLNSNENVHSSTIGMVVDYFTRFVIGDDVKEAFKTSLLGAWVAANPCGFKEMERVATKLLDGIKGLDTQSVINACKLVSFDVWACNPALAKTAKRYDEINPDEETVENIKILVKRGVAFFEKYGPVVEYGFTVKGGCTTTVLSGKGDFLTSDTLWDFKVSKSKLTSNNTLQLLMYWIMGQHSGQVVFKNITKLGVFNPRLNVVYLLDVSKISVDVIKAVEDDVICY